MSVAKPSSIIPVYFFLSFLLNIVNIIPMRASIGVNEEGFNSWIKTFSLSMPARLKIHAVTVVPMLAPIITLMDC